MATPFKRVAPGIYRYKGKKDGLYERVDFDGLKNWFKLESATTIDEAKRAREQNRVNHRKWRAGEKDNDGKPYVSPYIAELRGIAKAQTEQVRPTTMDEICQLFLDSDCPDKEREFKKGKQLEEEKRRVGILRSWRGWTEQPVERITLAVLDRYETWRRQTSKLMKNGRTIDMEVTTLGNILHWATRQERIKVNPFATLKITSFQRGSSVPAKECAMKSPEEVHDYARILFGNPQSEVLGFQELFECYTGVRTSEAIRCRWDAKYEEAGFSDGSHLHLNRSKSGVNPWAKIHPALGQLLKVMKLWRNTYYPKSPWFFPSPVDSTKPVGPQSLAHALRRITNDFIATGKLPEGTRRHSHGCRAFYVWVRRSEMAPDGLIAAEIGDATGAPIIAKHYGPLPPNWYNSKVGKITWLPGYDKKMKKRIQPAWAVLKLGADKVIHLPKAA